MGAAAAGPSVVVESADVGAGWADMKDGCCVDGAGGADCGGVCTDGNGGNSSDRCEPVGMGGDTFDADRSAAFGADVDGGGNTGGFVGSARLDGIFAPASDLVICLRKAETRRAGVFFF